MDLSGFYKAVLEADEAPIVLCDLEHTVIYMNPAAKKRYAASGDLTGKSIFGCHRPETAEMIRKVVAWFAADESHNSMYYFYNKAENKDVYMIALRDEEHRLIGYYEKHVYRTRETRKMYDFS